MALSKTEQELLNELETKKQITVTYFTGSGRVRGARGTSGKRKYDIAKKMISDGKLVLVEKSNSGYGYNLTVKLAEKH